ncbi:hypothetical protein UlMin_039022 [Ulmus minor]
MEALQGAPQIPPNPNQFKPNTEKIKRRLLNKDLDPTPKIIHTLRKKEIQKHNRKAKRLADRAPEPPLTESQKQALEEDSRFQTLKREYKCFDRAVKAKNGAGLMVGKPWERVESVCFRELASSSGEYGGDKLRREELGELRRMFEARKREELQWVLDDDVEVQEEWLESGKRSWEPSKRRRSEVEVIRFLVDRLSDTKLTIRDWKLSRIMKQSGLQFTEGQLLKIVEALGAKGCWQQAISVVHWVFDDKEKRHSKSRFIHTKLLAVLGKARRPEEALKIFNLMRGDFHIYPDMAAYHSIAVTLGQAGRLRELLNIIEGMRQKPSKRTKNMRYKNWDPVLEPDVVVYNAVLNACVPSHQWKGVSWVFSQLRKSGLKPNGATYGLAMEVMLQSGKYDLVHEFFGKMKRSGETPKALTYKVLVRAFWGEGKVNEAVRAVRDMEQRGVVGAGSVYYELACCLCRCGRWQDAMLEVEKMKKLSNTRPLEVTFTGMIMSSMDGGHIDDCIAIFKHMTNHCTPNIGSLNIMLKVYGRNDMFSKAKELFEEIKGANTDSFSSPDGQSRYLVPDEYTYCSMLEASASALQWEYFEYVYKEMVFSGFQLDQSKHASLLLEASRAGKWHLLEHAFDVLLESGEIPNPLYFTAMVFQTAAQNDYERSVTLVNAMSYAPFQVSKEQWKELFEKNSNRINQDNLFNLSNALANSKVKSEATIVNLSRALQSLCAAGTSGDLSSSNPMASHSEELIDENSDSDSDEDLLLYSSDAPLNVSSVFGASTGREMAYSSSNIDDEDGETNLPTSTTGFAKDEALIEFNGSMHAKLLTISEYCEDVEETELEPLLDGIEDFHDSSLPSAYEVLEAWKESRKKDGIHFPFQLGQR